MALVLSRSFRQEMNHMTHSIFGENLIFSFLFGGFAKGYANARHDIDTFICVNRKFEDQISRYHEWILSAHRKLGLEHDSIYPFEIVTVKYLNLLVDNCDFELKAHSVNDADDFDKVTWIQAISDKKIFISGDRSRLMFYESKFENIPEKWKRQAMDQDPDNLTLAQYSPLDVVKKYYTFNERRLGV